MLTQSYPTTAQDQATLARRALSHVRSAIRADTPETERQALSAARYLVSDLARQVEAAAFNERARSLVSQVEIALRACEGPRSPWLTVAGDLLGRLAQTEGR